MPAALIGLLQPAIAGFLATLGASTWLVAVGTGVIASALVYGGLALAAYAISAAFTPKAPEAPKPEDGKFNLKANVPPLVYVLGEVKKGGDYVLLEEKGGVAYHIVSHAAHHIKGFKQHYLHDELVGLDGAGTVVSPGHFGSKVRIENRRGANAETAYGSIVAALPGIWTADHRGDGIASIAMAVTSVAAENLQSTFPSNMPMHTAVIEGHDQLIDPRTGLAGYSKNLAVFRAWHLTHPVGAKLNWDDLYLPEWAHAADVCDQLVINRAGASVPRYHGGLWFRANNSPVQVGLLLDQAAELVVYERADGKVGVHAGEFVEPDIRLTADDIISVRFDANQRRASRVLAVRGRFNDPAKLYNTTDAAIYGEPYPSDDERTKTVDNQAVQDHNHIARLQTLAWKRAHAPLVTVRAHYGPARRVPYRRYVRVHLPPKMVETVVELKGRPKRSLRNMTVEFEGWALPGDIYPFNAASEEGAPGANIVPVVRGDVPVPAGFDVTILTESVGGGQLGSYALAEFDFQNDTFQYELEWQQMPSGVAQTLLGPAGALEVRTGYLSVGVAYRFRARTWSGGARSSWTTYETRTITGDTTPPAVPSLTSVALDGVDVRVQWKMPNSANTYAARVWRAPTGTAFGLATEITGQVLGTANQELEVVDVAPASGSYDYWVTAENAGGYESAPAGPVTQVVP